MGNVNKVERLEDHVEMAKKTRVLTMVGKHLKEIPLCVMDLAPTVRTMDFSNNKIRSMPIALGNFIEVKQIILDHNLLTELPVEVARMKKLEVFQVGYNKIAEIPETFSKLANLKTLSLQSNCLKTFPNCLCELKNLDTLDLSGNKIENLPEDIETLQVMELNMNRNKLKSLPESLAACPRLKVLRLEENLLGLTSITREFLINSQVSLLAVEGNLFQMKELYDLDGYDKYMERYTATKKKYI